ncbi:MAG: glycosyltransferase family 2 protein [Bacteroidota bacterium]
MASEQDKTPLVTIAICTYRRPVLLERCLKGLRAQQEGKDFFEILVVDNAGQDEAQLLTQRYQARYIKESTLGLSSARNCALGATKTEWIFYLDDDAIAHADLVANFLSLVKSRPSMIAIGGRFEHYFSEPPPRWLWRYYENDCRPAPGKGLITLKDHQYLLGGIMAFKVELLEKLNGFRTDLGMKGMANGYGEENELQDRIRQRGIPIYYSPRLAMKHLVHPRKLSITGQVSMAYAHGRAQATMKPTAANSPVRLVWEFLKIIHFSLPLELLRVLFKPAYYWQNGMVSIRSKLAFARGKYGAIHP